MVSQVEEAYAEKVALVGEQQMRDLERNVMLQVMDNSWREHLASMDYLRQGIHLRGYAQKNPKQEYKRESFEMFQNLGTNIKHSVASLLASIQIQYNEDVAVESESQELANMQAIHADAPDMQSVLSESRMDLATEAFDPAKPSDDTEFSPAALAAKGLAVHRNDPCPCGSGLKYKQCHGKLA